MDRSSSEVFASKLQSGEKILWQGQPEGNVRLHIADLFVIPFALFWGWGAVHWEVGVVRRALSASMAASMAEQVFAAIIGVILVVVALYVNFGRFFYIAWRRKNTYYALTDRRVLICTKRYFLASRRVEEIFWQKDISYLSHIRPSASESGFGSINFGDHTLFSDNRIDPATVSTVLWRKVPMHRTPLLDQLSFSPLDDAVFHDIKDAKKVYDLVEERKNQK